MQLLKELAVFTLAVANQGCQHLEAGLCWQVEHLVDNLLGGLPADGIPALGAMRFSYPGVEQAQVVVDLGDGPHRRARIARC